MVLKEGRVLSVFLANNDTCPWYLTCHILMSSAKVSAMDVIISGGRRGWHAKGQE
jgi:hypothetical protein